MKKRIFAVILTVLMVLSSVLTGCGKTQTTQKKDDNNSKDISANLRILYPGTSAPEKKVAEDIKAAVKKKYPNINIEFMYLTWADIEKKLTVMVNTKDFPDMMEVQDVTNCVAMDALEPLDSYFNDNIKKEDFLKAPLEYMQVDGKTYAVPSVAIVYAHAYNTDMLKNAGYKPEDIETWDDVKAAAQKMTANGKYGYAMANGGTGRFTFRDFMMVALSNGITPDDVSEKSKKAYIETLNMFNDLSSYMPKSQVTWLYPELFKAWEANSVGMMHTGAYYSANVITNGTTNFDRTVMLPFPKGPSADKNQIMVGASGMAIIKGSKQKEAAWKVMEIINSPEILGEWAGSLGVCAKKTVSEQDLEAAYKQTYPQVYKQHAAIISSFQKEADQYGVPMPKILGQPQMEPIVQGALVKMMDKKATPEQAYDEIKAGIEKVKASLKK